MSCVCHGECQTMLCSILECCIQRVCRCVYPYLKNHMSIFHEILCTCCLFACRHGLFSYYNIKIRYAFPVLGMTLFSHFGASRPSQAQWQASLARKTWMTVCGNSVCFSFLFGIVVFPPCAILPKTCMCPVFVTENARQCFIQYWSIAVSMSVDLFVVI